jgi:peptidoglycan/xylan/chitin deacetylase (PgdA/CDA1 family)
MAATATVTRHLRMLVLVAGALLLGSSGSLQAVPAPAPPAMTSPPTATVISRTATDEKVLALTFDAGADSGHTMAILDILEVQQVKATFFLTADWLEQNPELGQAIASRGHCLGNHTASHPHLTEITDDEVTRELTRTEEAAQRACGRSTRPFFRPPFGEYDERICRLAARAGYEYLILWTIDSRDWQMIPAEELTARIVENVQPGAIVLMHVGSQTKEPEALPETIRQLRAKGYRFATLDELLNTGKEKGIAYYTVKPGDTLTSIARTFGVTAGELLKANGLADGNVIQAGQVLIVPLPSGKDIDPRPGEPGAGRAAKVGRSFMVRFVTVMALVCHRLGELLLRLLASARGIA